MILLGKPVAEKIYEGLEQEITTLSKKPILAVILVGEDPASIAYTKIKEKKAETLGIAFKLYQFPKIVSQYEIEKLIYNLNKNEFIKGIVVQLPLPELISTEKILSLIDPKKDIDGFSGNFPAPTAQAILDILKFYKIDIKNKKIVIVGHGRLVGKPLEKLLLSQNITPIVCDSNTKDLNNCAKKADILVSAAGVPGLITSEMIKPETIIIDAGTSEANGKLAGDVDPKVYEKVKSYTPTPGGVGPVTVAELLKNLVKASK